eukprot:13314107-Ditylum_brightwellii.AAC.1
MNGYNALVLVSLIAGSIIAKNQSDVQFCSIPEGRSGCEGINHVRDASSSFIKVLGTLLSLDEMMIRFMGRSVETHHMKNKQIG